MSFYSCSLLLKSNIELTDFPWVSILRNVLIINKCSVMSLHFYSNEATKSCISFNNCSPLLKQSFEVYFILVRIPKVKSSSLFSSLIENKSVKSLKSVRYFLILTVCGLFLICIFSFYIESELLCWMWLRNMK